MRREWVRGSARVLLCKKERLTWSMTFCIAKSVVMHPTGGTVVDCISNSSTHAPNHIITTKRPNSNNEARHAMHVREPEDVHGGNLGVRSMRASVCQRRIDLP